MVQIMLSYNKFYLPYLPQADINYIYLFYLYRIAERYEQGGVKSDINYKSTTDLLGQINSKGKVISYSTLNRLLKNTEYQPFFKIDERGLHNTIILNNEFSNKLNKKQSFVVLNPKTYNLLIQQKNNLLAKYTIYIKHSCGLYGGQSDFTANQFLSTFGYSINSNNTKDMLSGFNLLLEKEQIISIDRNRLEDGKRRNIYTFIDTDATCAKPSIGLDRRDKTIDGFVF